MATIELVTSIQAPQQRCFDLARSIDLHVRSTSRTGERAVAGVTHGLIGLGEEVTWQARHFGVWQRFTSRITAFDPPRYFQDAMLRGAFKRFVHDHDFRPVSSGTEMIDRLQFEAPGGLVGRLIDRALLSGYLARFLAERNRLLKRIAESDEWRDYLERER
jgi:ligand-binding SRPBCC domain-containing protein